jgi:hypothetical protein
MISVALPWRVASERVRHSKIARLMTLRVKAPEAPAARQ